ncbi:inositol monophosphatase [Halorubellus sp. JP-L1]|uniref:inositol monophosphatase family protein n=1 Tax=Halorubellus sp. JP-L1 TaxID=2715753 RepID=UPI00140AAB6D|nr:inositol monophosphatase [Halorubellus sp. JP-L1]NHN40694.1 inositol monophosphatase [Halorubellus sp. JP-L1]
MTEDARARADVALAAARAGSAVAESRFRTDIDVETKDGKTDVVTQADRDAQAAVVDAIRERFDADAIVGEEDDELKSVPEEGPAWVVDPIDGTNNYVHGMRFWATSVAAVVDGEPVAAATIAPALGDAYVVGPDGVRRDDTQISVAAETDPERLAAVPTIWWDFDRREEYAAACRAAVERFGDVRRFGCAQLALASVAEGAVGGTFTNVAANPWDTIAGVHLVREAGGRVTDLEGERWRHDSRGLVASNGAVHDAVLAAARETDAARDD